MKHTTVKFKYSVDGHEEEIGAKLSVTGVLECNKVWRLLMLKFEEIGSQHATK